MLSIQWTTRDDAAQRGLSSALRLESTQPRLDFKETRTKKKKKIRSKKKLQNYNSNSNKKKGDKTKLEKHRSPCSSHLVYTDVKRLRSLSRRKRCDPYPRFDSSFSPCLFILALFRILFESVYIYSSLTLSPLSMKRATSDKYKRQKIK